MSFDYWSKRRMQYFLEKLKDIFDIKANISDVHPTATYYGECATAGDVAAKIVTVSDSTFSIQTGTIVGVRFTNTNTASNVTLNVNGTGDKSIYYSGSVYTGSTGTVTGAAGGTNYYMYDGTYWTWLNAYKLDGNTNTIPSAYCDTAKGTAAKEASCSGYYLLANSYIHVILTVTNTASSALTLNINGKGAKPIYINGTASSASNYSLTRGSYIVYYDGTNYYFRTDGKLTGAGLVDIAGNTSKYFKGDGTLDIPVDEKVKQTNTTVQIERRVLLSASDSETEETGQVYKSPVLRVNPYSGIIIHDAVNSGTAITDARTNFGNSTPDGTTGSTYGVLRIYGKKNKYFAIADTYDVLTDNRRLTPPDKSGTIAITDDVDTVDNKISLYEEYGYLSRNLAKINVNNTYTCMTVVDNNDGTLTISNDGTNSASIAIQIATVHVKAGVPYKLVGCPSGGSGYRLDLRSNITTIVSSPDYGEGVVYTPEADADLMLCVRFTAGTVATSLLFKPMVTIEQDATYADFETYIKSNVELESEIPTKTSDLTNDNGFVTTDENVKQAPDTGNTDRRILLSSSDSDSTQTNSVYKNSGFIFNPSKSALYIKRETTTADDSLSSINLTVKDTDLNITDTSTISARSPHTSSGSGANLVVNAKGALFAGGGESANNLYLALKGSGTGYTSENAFFTADSSAFLLSNCNTIENRLGIGLDTNGAIKPVLSGSYADNAGKIGISGNRFAEGNFVALNGTSLNGVTIGNSPKFTDTDEYYKYSFNNISDGLTIYETKYVDGSATTSTVKTLDIVNNMVIAEHQPANTNVSEIIAVPGKYFTWGNVLCKAIANIAEDDALIEDTNYIDVESVAEVLETIDHRSNNFYGTCATAAATAAKTVVLSDARGFQLRAGTIVGVKFSYTNTASNVTLNVNNTGDKSIYYSDAVYTGDSSNIVGAANRVIYYMYDGTYWVFLNQTNNGTNTTYSAMSVAEMNAATATSSRSIRADRLRPTVESWIDAKIPGAVSKTASGLCPQLPNETATSKFLRQDGTWAEPSGGSGSNNYSTTKTAVGTWIDGRTIYKQTFEETITGNGDLTITVGSEIDFVIDGSAVLVQDYDYQFGQMTIHSYTVNNCDLTEMPATYSYPTFHCKGTTKTKVGSSSSYQILMNIASYPTDQSASNINSKLYLTVTFVEYAS